jgi:hypothetical protein
MDGLRAWFSVRGSNERWLRYILVRLSDDLMLAWSPRSSTTARWGLGGREEGSTYGGPVPLEGWSFGRFSSGYFAFTLLLSWNTRYSAVGIF